MADRTENELQPILVGLLTQQPELPLHGSTACVGVAPPRAPQRDVPHPVEDRRLRQRQPLRDLHDAQAALYSKLAGLLADVGGVRHCEHMFARLPDGSAVAPASIPQSSAAPEEAPQSRRRDGGGRGGFGFAGQHRREDSSADVGQLAALRAAQIRVPQRRAAAGSERAQLRRRARRMAPGRVARQRVVARGREPLAEAGQPPYAVARPSTSQCPEAGDETIRRPTRHRQRGSNRLGRSGYFRGSRRTARPGHRPSFAQPLETHGLLPQPQPARFHLHELSGTQHAPPRAGDLHGERAERRIRISQQHPIVPRAHVGPEREHELHHAGATGAKRPQSARTGEKGPRSRRRTAARGRLTGVPHKSGRIGH